MINNKLHTLNKTDYEALRYALIEQFEESGNPKVDIYTDTKGIVTMGVGFNVAVKNNLETVLTLGLGIDSQNTGFKAGKTFTDLVGELHTETKNTYTKNQHNITGATLSTLKTTLDGIIAKYLVTPIEFRFVDDPVTKSNGQTASEKIRATFDELATNFEETLSNRFSLNTVFDDGTRVPPNTTNVNNMAYSHERLALISLEYNNGNKLLGNNLIAALKNDDRITAWYEIRYASNGDKLDGQANRRYIESQLFGLYPPNQTDSEKREFAKQLKAFFAADQYPGGNNNIEQMIAYEQKYGKNVAAAQLRIDAINNALLPAIDTFQKQFVPISAELAEVFGSSGLSIPNIGPSIDEAEKQIILTALGGIQINDEVVVGLETGGNVEATNKNQTGDGNDLLIAIKDTGQILSGGQSNDILIGGKGTDKLYGGSENDILIGNHGKDELYGQKGEDTLFGGYGNDKLYADENVDRTDRSDNYLYGGKGDDELYGAAGKDVLKGGTGQDKLYGGKGDDILYAQSDNLKTDTSKDELHGGADNDTLYGDAGNDILDGGQGRDLWQANILGVAA